METYLAVAYGEAALLELRKSEMGNVVYYNDMQRSVKKEAFKQIKMFHEFEPTPVMDTLTRVWYIGYGHTNSVRSGMVLTKEDAEMLLRDDLRRCGDAVSRLVRVKLSNNQFDALACFIFEHGSAAFEHSTLRQLLNNGWYDQVPANLMLRCRNAAEGKPSQTKVVQCQRLMALWNTPDDED
jgi:lysozyme